MNTMKSIIVSTFVLAVCAAGVSASMCVGNPPMFNGMPCATTTRYWDGQMGACGCGTGNSDPFDWQWTSHTAAASQLIYDAGGSGWCGSGCGSCFELTPTGDCIYGTDCAVFSAPITIMVSNRCPYIGNEQWCPNPGSSNQYGYHAHFDLMDHMMSGWVDALGWNNPVVTYRQVPCGNEGSPSCGDASQCECSTAQCSVGSNSTSATTGSVATSTTAATSATTHAATTAATTVTTVASSTTASTSTSTSTSGSAATTVSNSNPSTSTSTSSGSGSGSGCSAVITQSLGQTWNGGGLINIVIINTGTSPISQVSFNLAQDGIATWNMEVVSSNVWNLPSWSYPIQPGHPFTSAGFTYTTSQPQATLASVRC
uniref:Cellulase n=1 Tax=uncultured eukaryote TaxID=100272 RepID=G8YZT4_9EUKA|nr:putative glycoside hydrolase family 45 [uncultured eukaryote]